MCADFADDPVLRLERDHVHLGETLSELKGHIASAAGGTERAKEVYEELSEGLRRLRDDMLLHFAEEEEGVFPLLARDLPDVADRVLALATNHDAICRTILRMASLVDQGPDAISGSALGDLLVRLEAAYVAHADAEIALLRQVRGRLDGAQLAELLSLVKGL
jgi:hypothetical protein